MCQNRQGGGCCATKSVQLRPLNMNLTYIGIILVIVGISTGFYCKVWCDVASLISVDHYHRDIDDPCQNSFIFISDF